MSASDVCGSETENRGSESGKRGSVTEQLGSDGFYSKDTFVPFEVALLCHK